ncbi:ATP-binding cassette domain-containing protein [Actinacidiphila glaucinigra]|uniref:ATP-binding cassette domain-containing protein n=1 Tax=Actinacidiphila glaucinigra TaxID=235986 RepID=UPI0035E0FEB9
MAEAISAQGLVKTFGGVRALAGVDLEVAQGTVLGLLGPNGAGKTSTVRVLTTLLRPDAGRAFVAGVDVLRQPDKVRGLIGLSGQYAAVDEYLTGTENLRMVGELYQMTTREAKARAKELIDRFGLGAAADRPAKTYSGGMRRRLDLAAALVVRPPVLFLDEPTTGLDPHNRIALWEVIESLAEHGSTILLTTQYLEEADRLADDIVVVDHGRVIARGSSDELKARTGTERVEIVVRDRDGIPATVEAVASFATGRVDSDRRTRRITVPVEGGAPVLAEMILELERRRLRPDDICLRKPTLDEVFLSLTSHASRPANDPDPRSAAAPSGNAPAAAGRDL